MLFGVWCSECRSPRENPSLYPEAKGILNALKQKGVTMAVASRTPTPDIARNFLNKLSLVNHFADMVWRVEVLFSWLINEFHNSLHDVEVSQNMT